MKIRHRFFLFLAVCLFAPKLPAQFLNSIGITAGITYGNERWKEPALHLNKAEKYMLGYNGSVFAEFFSHDYFRWVSEFQYNQKGSGDPGNTATKLDYFCFNNYLKVRDELLRIIPYGLIGPRVEYRYSAASSSPLIRAAGGTGGFVPIHLSLAIGGGVEWVAYGPFKFFTEAFYNPDVMNAYNENGLKIHNNAFELRVGLKFVFSKRSKGMNCNSPTYIPD
jgi:hypothetical protein